MATMRYRALGASGIKVSELCLGTMMFGGPTYEAQTRYRYQVAGKDYESTRVGLDALSNSDNIDDWHRQWVGRLQTAQAAGQRITVWVNPDDPSQSLIDRSVRWSLQIFRLPFALVFTGVGLVAAWFFLRTLLGLFKPADSASEERGSDSGEVIAGRVGRDAPGRGTPGRISRLDHDCGARRRPPDQPQDGHQ